MCIRGGAILTVIIDVPPIPRARYARRDDRWLVHARHASIHVQPILHTSRDGIQTTDEAEPAAAVVERHVAGGLHDLGCELVAVRGEAEHGRRRIAAGLDVAVVTTAIRTVVVLVKFSRSVSAVSEDGIGQDVLLAGIVPEDNKKEVSMLVN